MYPNKDQGGRSNYDVCTCVTPEYVQAVGNKKIPPVFVVGCAVAVLSPRPTLWVIQGSKISGFSILAFRTLTSALFSPVVFLLNDSSNSWLFSDPSCSLLHPTLLQNSLVFTSLPLAYCSFRPRKTRSETTNAQTPFSHAPLCSRLALTRAPPPLDCRRSGWI